MSSTPRTPAPAPTTPDPYGGYRLTRVKRAGGEETERFEATLTHHGTPVAHVSNGGEGASHRIQPLGDGGWAAIGAFTAFAVQWNAGSRYAGLEDDGQLVSRLLEVDSLNRMRTVPFTLDGQDPWADEEGEGGWYVLRGRVTRDQVLETLRAGPYADRQPRVWDKGVCDFVPLVSAGPERQR